MKKNISLFFVFLLLFSVLHTLTANQKNKSKKDLNFQQLLSQANQSFLEKNCENLFAVHNQLVTASKTSVFSNQEIAILYEISQLAENMMSNLSAEITDKSKPTEKLKEFSEAFSVKYTWRDTNEPAENIPVTITYPSDSVNGIIHFTETIAKTDASGKVYFTTTPVFSCKSTITFEVTSRNKSISNGKIIMPYEVTTNLKSAGGTLAIVDMNKENQPIVTNSISSSRLLSTLINSGFRKIGNVDFVSQVVADNDAEVQKTAVSLFGKSNTYIIYGTVQYDNVSQTSDGFSVTLKASIKVRDLLQDTELYQTTVIESAQEKTEVAATNSARMKLVEKLKDNLLYNM